jgi:hypothetical protein
MKAGHWSWEEHDVYQTELARVGRNFRAISRVMYWRDAKQICTHDQKMRSLRGRTTRITLLNKIESYLLARQEKAFEVIKSACIPEGASYLEAQCQEDELRNMLDGPEVNDPALDSLNLSEELIRQLILQVCPFLRQELRDVVPPPPLPPLAPPLSPPLAPSLAPPQPSPPMPCSCDICRAQSQHSMKKNPIRSTTEDEVAPGPFVGHPQMLSPGEFNCPFSDLQGSH